MSIINLLEKIVLSAVPLCYLVTSGCMDSSYRLRQTADAEVSRDLETNTRFLDSMARIKDASSDDGALDRDGYDLGADIHTIDDATIDSGRDIGVDSTTSFTSDGGIITSEGYITTPADFKVAFLADTGRLGDFHGVLELIRSESAELVLISGDLGYGDNRDGTTDPLAPLEWYENVIDVLGDNFPIFYCIGEDDIRGWVFTDGSLDYRTILQNRFIGLGLEYEGDPAEVGSKTFFKYSGLAVALVAPGINSGRLDAPFAGTDHHDFLDEHFSRNRDRIWKLVIGHYPPTGSGLVGDGSMYPALHVGNSSGNPGWSVHDVALDYGAMQLHGEVHTYARSLSYTASGGLITPVGDENNLIISPGRSFITNVGLGGRSLHYQTRYVPVGTSFPSGYPIHQGGFFPYVVSASTDVAAIPPEEITAGVLLDGGALFVTFNVGGNPRRAEAYFKTRYNYRMFGGHTLDRFSIENRLGLE